MNVTSWQAIVSRAGERVTHFHNRSKAETVKTESPVRFRFEILSWPPFFLFSSFFCSFSTFRIGEFVSPTATVHWKNHVFNIDVFVDLYTCVCVCVCASVCVCVCARARASVRERERERVCVCERTIYYYNSHCVFWRPIFNVQIALRWMTPCIMGAVRTGGLFISDSNLLDQCSEDGIVGGSEKHRNSYGNARHSGLHWIQTPPHHPLPLHPKNN